MEASFREGGMINKGVKTMLGNPTETNDLSKWEHMDLSVTAEKVTLDQTRLHERGCLVVEFGSLWGLWQRNRMYP